ncbi:MAG: hypothetical protein IPM25_06305 [Chloracidobacterium sp.]|nr:hypothetical protein [Chloracidobacterium sp.]
MNLVSRKNLANMTLSVVILFAGSACFWSSERSSVDDPAEPAEENVNAIATNQPRSTQPVNPAKRRDEGDFIVQHLDVTSPAYQEFDRHVRSSRLLEDAAEKLNRSLSLPRDVFLRTKDCKEVNAFYDPNDRSITICYELMGHFYRIFKSAGESDEKAYDKMNDAVRFVFVHELGHALIDQYKLPVAGNEEDAADRCSAYVNLKELGEDGARAVYAAADAFAIESKQGDNSKRNLADEHLLREQRFYNSLCMIYGSDPEKHSRIVEGGYLPKERAVRCEGEFRRAVESWVSLLEPWRKA